MRLIDVSHGVESETMRGDLHHRNLARPEFAL
jgi:hypothetical protein